jgi:hypothetical protein
VRFYISATVQLRCAFFWDVAPHHWETGAMSQNKGLGGTASSSTAKIKAN